jgi:hypothetical protein
MTRQEIEGVLGEYLYEGLCRKLPFGEGLAYGGNDEDDVLVVKDKEGFEWEVEVDVTVFPYT